MNKADRCWDWGTGAALLLHINTEAQAHRHTPLLPAFSVTLSLHAVPVFGYSLCPIHLCLSCFMGMHRLCQEGCHLFSHQNCVESLSVLPKYWINGEDQQRQENSARHSCTLGQKHNYSYFLGTFTYSLSFHWKDCSFFRDNRKIPSTWQFSGGITCNIFAILSG